MSSVGTMRRKRSLQHSQERNSVPGGVRAGASETVCVDGVSGSGMSCRPSAKGHVRSHQRARNTWWAVSSSLMVAKSAVPTSAGDGPLVDSVPPLPTRGQDVEEWVSDRNCELRNALEFGDATIVALIAVLLTQGGSQVEQFEWTQFRGHDGVGGPVAVTVVHDVRVHRFSGCEEAVVSRCKQVWASGRCRRRCLAIKCGFYEKSTMCSSRI